MKTSTPSAQQLRRAVEIAEQIERLEKELRTLLGQKSPAKEATEEAAPARVPKKRLQKGKKRTMSPEARAKIGAAQRARWAKVKGKK